MKLWRRAPREVYRVYEEDEYLEEGERRSAEPELWGSGYEESPAPAFHQEQSSSFAEEAEPGNLAGTTAPYRDRDARHDLPTSHARAAPLVGVGVLVGVTVGVLSLVALNASHRPSAGSRAATNAHAGTSNHASTLNRRSSGDGASTSGSMYETAGNPERRIRVSRNSGVSVARGGVYRRRDEPLQVAPQMSACSRLPALERVRGAERLPCRFAPLSISGVTHSPASASSEQFEPGGSSAFTHALSEPTADVAPILDREFDFER